MTTGIWDYEAILAGLQQKAEATPQKDLAQQLGISPQYLNDVLQERRHLSDNLAEKLGFRKITTLYEKKEA